MRAISVMLSAFVIASAVQPLPAQERTSTGERSLAAYDLPRDVYRRLTLIVDHPNTKRFEGAARVAAGETVASSVVAFAGPLTIEGKIDGELIVVGGDVEFRQGAAVTGDVTVIAGKAIDADVATIGGSLTTYSEGFELYHRGERILAVNTRRTERGRDRDWERERDDRDWDHWEWNSWGRSTLALRTGINYNRVEGLPIMFGPIIQTGGASPTRIEALGILRTGSGDMFDADRMGYQLRVEQFLGTSAFRIGGVAHSVINPIEDWTVTDLEASLSTFLLHEDQRDYFEREGWGVYARFAPRRTPIDLRVGYYHEEHGSVAARDPWTLFGDGSWRRQPLVGEGTLRSLSGRLEIDQRNRRDFPLDGFYVNASLTHGLGGSLEQPGWVNTDFGIDRPALPFNEKFNAGLVDVRLYRRVGADAALAFRGVAGGSLEDSELPPQFQHALGGAGTLPGYKLMSADCGARSQVVFRDSDTRRTYFPRYGCDRFAMGSVEYRGGFDFDFGGNFDFFGHDHEDHEWRVDASPSWMLFFNAGQGWALGESAKLGASDTGILYDAGAGIVLGDFGIYAAVPLKGDRRPVNLFVRLGARF